MTNDQAILHLKGVKATTDSGQMHRAIDMAIEALEKQIPKKPIIKDGHCYCPNKCRSGTKYALYWTVGMGENYCSRCGQAIDWEAEE